VGLQVVIGAMGVGGAASTFASDLPLIIAFIILAAFTYSSGLRAPASIAIVKDILIYITAFAAVIVVPIQLGGFGHIFAAVPPAKLLLAVPGPNTTGAYGIYATLALGSALALFLYPLVLSGVVPALICMLVVGVPGACAIAGAPTPRIDSRSTGLAPAGRGSPAHISPAIAGSCATASSNREPEFKDSA